MTAFAYNPLRSVELLSIRLLRESEEQLAERAQQRRASLDASMATHCTDIGNDLMLALQRDDPFALQGLFALYNGRLFSYVCRIVIDAESAEDVLQETWLSLYERRDSYRPTYKFSTWIFTIARRKALSELRRRKVRSIMRSLNFGEGDRQGEMVDVPQEMFESPDRCTDGVMLNALVERALAMLPAHQREIVMLRDIEGFENEEIARILQWNLKPGAIRKRVFDEREAFRRAMLKLGYREEQDAQRV